MVYFLCGYVTIFGTIKRLLLLELFPIIHQKKNKQERVLGNQPLALGPPKK